MLNGLFIYSVAPLENAMCLLCESSLALMMTIGVLANWGSARKSAHSSKPFRWGIIRSRVIRSGLTDFAMFIASVLSFTTNGSCRSMLTKVCMRLVMSTSSSTISIFAISISRSPRSFVERTRYLHCTLHDGRMPRFVAIVTHLICMFFGLSRYGRVDLPGFHSNLTQHAGRGDIVPAEIQTWEM
jgi:hypothetical protein